MAESGAGSAIADQRRRRRRLPWRDLKALDRERLQAAMQEFSVEKARRQQESPGLWAGAAEQHAGHAEDHLQGGRIDAAWSALKAANRELVDAYNKTELLVEAARVGREAEDKLHGWRREAVVKALSPVWDRLEDASRLKERITKALTGFVDGEDYPAVTVRAMMLSVINETPDRDEGTELPDLRHRVKAARFILDEHMDNVYRKLRLLSRDLVLAGSLLLTLLVTTIVLLAVVVQLGWSPERADPLLVDVRSVVVIMALGAVGGAVSGLLSLFSPTTQTRIPDVKAQRYLVILRPLIGGTAALIVVAILQSDVGGFRAEPETALTAAFVAGFSERLVGRAVAAASSAITK